ncbi:MAG TPA: nucleotidyltransferase domain-containing protein [Thermoleophilaceae bacterium]|nr:nucleotidyltransferase domain-containing protein [Thermoleophilaceae bacterium]
MNAPTHSSPLGDPIAVPRTDPASWKARISEDRQRAVRLQTPAQRRITKILVRRTRACGGIALALTGSTARGKRTSWSDLDYYVVGPRPHFVDLPEDLDVYATQGPMDKLWEGDDFIQWTLLFGCILFDSGVLREVFEELIDSEVWPDPQRKLSQAIEASELAASVLSLGDADLAREQVSIALSHVARWLLLKEHVFPLSRSELPAQLRQFGHQGLAEALERSLSPSPTANDLRSCLTLASCLTAET